VEKCQATKTEDATVELPSQSPDGPYRLSAEAAIRLEKRSLRPLEWFNLALIHGPFEFHLHDDFYDDNGNAHQPVDEVHDADRFPCPTLSQCASDLQRLLDFALTRWQFTPPLLNAAAVHSDLLIAAVPQRFTQTRNPWIHQRLVELASNVLGLRAGQWFRDVFVGADVYQRLLFLHLGHKCVPNIEGRRLAEESLAALLPRELAGWCIVLAHFRDTRVLDWIEENISEPLTCQWGHTAAASHIDSNRVLKWLESGRPLSLVALDALAACTGPGPDQSKVIQQIRPRLDSNVPTLRVAEALTANVSRDNSPRIRKMTEYVLGNLEKITNSL
jgi:hypothetical protein